MREACGAGHAEVANLLVSLGANLECGLQGACESGKLDMVVDFLNRGAHNICDALSYACESGNHAVVDFLIQRFTAMGPRSQSRAWNYGLSGACKSGDRSLILKMMSHGAGNWDNG